LTKHPEEGNAKERRYTLNGLLGRVSWNAMIWEYNDGECKRACRNTPKKGKTTTYMAN